MADAPETPDNTRTRDYRSTVFLPRTDFPMKAGLPQKEPAILARWIAEDIYGQVRKSRAGRQKFILHDGPPYANGDIHIGHALDRTLKDMVVRTQTLLGKDAPFVPGWDCHGLPIEWKIEEQYRKKKLNKDEVPIREFRAECRAYAQHWVEVQREQLRRLGTLADWDHPYLTMDYSAEGTIVGELMKFAENGQVYRGAKPVMWSPVEKTALAEAEIEYEDVVSTQIDVAFEIVESPIPELVGAYAVVWTTTPWTIPVNRAIAYGENVEYVLLSPSYDRQLSAASFDNASAVAGKKLLIARALLEQVQERLGFTSSVEHWSGRGSELAGTIAKHPMAGRLSSPLVGEDQGGGRDASASQKSLSAADATGPHPYPSPQGGGENGGFFAEPRPLLPGDHVTTDAGTGLVHMAPDHGEEDFLVCKAAGIDPVFVVNDAGFYRDDWAWLPGGGSVINAKFNAPDGPICNDLREAGALLAASADFQHSYPHSWRSKAKVIYRCTPQWFIAMDQPILPSPPSGGEGRGASAPKGAGDVRLPPLPAHAAHESPSPPEGGDRKTLRQLAMQAIADTRFVPEKGRNRLGSMVEQRPDWVLSRQRAWGVPIALFVERKTQALLVDPEVNRRIVEAVRADGVDAWSEENAGRFLGEGRDPQDYEMVRDILDVWFDSGSTHVFVLESGRWPDQRWPADLYLEGSDQHRGWFQSSLLESCGTRGRAPFDALLTHGFTMDAKGMKMSKSLGNSINPLDLMKEYGADILRLWALSVDFTEDHRIGKEILAGVADQYRKLRNTFRYLLGALADFRDEEKVGIEAMPELERYVLHLASVLDSKLKAAVEEFDFNHYVRALTDFCNDDLSAFYFDIRKDVLYCEVNAETGAQTEKRRANRTVLDILFHALVRWLSPVLVFTTEEVWGTRYPDAGSVHLLEWPEIPILAEVIPKEDDEFSAAWNEAARRLNSDYDDASQLLDKWAKLRAYRTDVNEAIEPLRREKKLGSSLEAEVTVDSHPSEIPGLLESVDLPELFISSEVRVVNEAVSEPYAPGRASGARIVVKRTDNSKCGRCWRYLPEVRQDGELCGRCEEVVNG